MYFYVLMFCISVGFLLSEEQEIKDLSQEIKIVSKREGRAFAEELKQNTEWIDLSSVAEGVLEYLADSKTAREQENVQNDEKYTSIEIRLFQLEAKKNVQKAEEFLHTVGKNSEVHILEEGKLMYIILSEGQGLASVQKDSTLFYTTSFR